MLQLDSEATRIFETIIKLLGDSPRIEINNNSAFMPLTVERLGKLKASKGDKELYSLAHYGEQYGDIMRDPEMLFHHYPSERRVVPIYYRNDYASVERWGGNFKGEITDPQEVKDQVEFANTWMRNIAEQQGICSDITPPSPSNDKDNQEAPSSSSQPSNDKDNQETPSSQANDSMGLVEFLKEFGEPLKTQLLEKMAPVYDPNNEDSWDKEARQYIEDLPRKPLEGQVKKGILPVAKALFRNNLKGAFLVGEMGIGKTFMSLAVASLYRKKNMRIIVQCPGHLVKKWIREAQMVFPGATIHNLNSKEMGILLEYKHTPKKPKGVEIYILGKERAKLHYRKKVFNTKEAPKCPVCGTLLGESKKIMRCFYCRSPLWQADRTGPRRYAKAEFIHRYLPSNFFDICILDEVHELKGGDTAQGKAMACLISKSKYTIALTGTLMGGYSSNLYFLLFRMFPEVMVEHGFDYGRTMQFAEKYGVLEKVYKMDGYDADTVQSIKRVGGKRVNLKEAPGISPLLLTDLLLSRSAFVRLSDVASALPPYDEIVVDVEMAEEQKDSYERLETTLVNATREALARGDHRLLGKMLQSLLAYPDGCRREEVVVVETKDTDGNVIDTQIVATAPALEYDFLPKEERLLKIIKAEISNGRKCAIYVEHTGTRDLIPVLTDRMRKMGINPLIMYGHQIPPEKREEWLEKKMKEGDYDCLVCNPRLVQTGLDLYRFPTIIFFQTGYSVFTLRQASRRSWRIGQEKPVKVSFLTYSNTMQEKALSLMAQKMETSLAVEGDLNDKGLAGFSESENNMVLELARALLGEKETKAAGDAWKEYKRTELTALSGLTETVEVEEKVTVTTTISTTDQNVTVSHEKLIRRGIVYPRRDGAVAYVGKARFHLLDGKILYNSKVVGFYDRKGKGEINGKAIRIARPRGQKNFVLYEILKAA